MKAEQVAIQPGMREDIDPRHLPIGTPRLLQNVRVRQGARFEHRPGQNGYGVSGLPASAASNWTSQWGGMPVVSVQDSVDSQISNSVYVKDASGLWNATGRHGFVVPERRVGLAMDWQSSLRSVSSTYIDGVLYFAWGDSSDVVHLCAVDPSSGVKLREATVSSANFPRLVYAGSGVLYLVHTDGSTALSVRTVTPSTLAVSGATSIDTLGGSNTYFDAAPMEGANTWLVASAITGGSTMRVRLMSGTTSTASADVSASGQATLMSIVGTSGSKVMVAWVDATDDAKVTSFSDTLTGANTATIQTKSSTETWFSQSSIVRTGSNEWHVMFAGSNAQTGPSLSTWFLYHGRVNGTPAATEGPYRGYRFQPASRLFTVGDAGSRKVGVVVHDAPTSGTPVNSAHLILELETTGDPNSGGQQVAAISYEHQPTAFTSGTRSSLCDVPALGSGRRAVAIPWADPNDLTGIDVLVFRSASSSDSVEATARQVKECDGALLVSGGALYEHCLAGNKVSPQTFPNRYLVENGWPNVPIINNSVVSGGALTAGTSYSYAVTYAWLDPSGNRVHRSAPSTASTASPTPTGSWLRATIRIGALGSSGRFGTSNARPVAEVYRSWNGGPYYYCGSTDILGSSASATYTDADTDATVEANRVLYTDLGILANEPPSGARLMCVGGGRVWTVGWKPRVPEFSKLMVPTAPVEFCDDDAFRVFGIDEDLTAIYWMDGAFVSWSKRKIYVVTGDGPNDQGVGSFSTPRELPCTCGADSPHVVEGPAGLFFFGAGTIWLLPRGFGPPVPVGDQIQKTIAAYPYLRGAVRCANDEYDLTHFLFAAGDTTTSPTVIAVWDNKLNAWSRDQLSCDIGAIGAVDGVLNVLLATWSALSAKPVRKLQDAVSDLNNSGTEVWNEMRVGFGDFRPYGPHGWGRLDRFQVHGEVDGLCNMNVVSVVEGTTGMNARGVTALATKPMTGIGQFYAENAIAYPPGGAFGFEIFDGPVNAGATSMTSGLVLHSVAFAPGEMQGLRKLSDQERF